MQLNISTLRSISSIELAFGTTRLLAPIETIPADFHNPETNIYAKISSALCHGKNIPNGKVTLTEAFEGESFADVKESLAIAVRAHIKSEEIALHHRVAGIAFMISQVMYVLPA